MLGQARTYLPAAVLAVVACIAGVPATSSAPEASDMTFHPALQPSMGYAAEVLHVLDGDTLELRIAVFPGHDIVARVRLARIDAPELACAGDRRAAETARRALRSLTEGQRLILRDPKPDKYYGRVVADLVTADGVDLSDRLVADGHAVPYGGGRRPRCRA